MIIINIILFLAFINLFIFVIALMNLLYYSIKLWQYYRSTNNLKTDVLLDDRVDLAKNEKSFNKRFYNSFYNVVESDDIIIVELKQKINRSRTLMGYFIIIVLSVIVLMSVLMFIEN